MQIDKQEFIDLFQIVYWKRAYPDKLEEMFKFLDED
jgi:hypothetical protein